MGKNYQSSTPFLWLHRLFIAPHLPLERDLKWSLVLSGSLFIAPHLPLERDLKWSLALSGSLFIAPHLPLETWLIKPLRLLQAVCNVAAHSHCKSVIYHVLPSPPTLLISSLWRFSRLLLLFSFHLSDRFPVSSYPFHFISLTFLPSPPTLSISSLWPFPRLLLAFLLNLLTVRDMIKSSPCASCERSATSLRTPRHISARPTIQIVWISFAFCSGFLSQFVAYLLKCRTSLFVAPYFLFCFL